ncbi:MAG: hypothetical protein ABIK28_04285, partial [Planctomycetota bacterium]
YLPDDLWVSGIEIAYEQLEESATAVKRPVIRVRGSGKEMGQPLQSSFTTFRKRLDADSLTHQVIPQVRYGEEFSYLLLISFSQLPGAPSESDEEAELR